MQGRYTYSLRAENDIKNIFLGTAREWGTTQAEKYDSGLEKSLRSLADNPDLGRKCDVLKIGYQCYQYGRHIIFYRKRKNDIFIIRILHDRMDVKHHL